MNSLRLTLTSAAAIALLATSSHATARQAERPSRFQLESALSFESSCARVSEDGYRARSSTQNWETHFDERGFTVEPQSASWSWGLQLERFGFADQETAISSPICTSLGDSRIIYRWNAGIEEWFVTGHGELEHGYTVYERPPTIAPHAPGPLMFALRIRGSLTPRLSDDGRDVSFAESGGSIALTYNGLRVFDAKGRDLEARFHLVDGGLLLTIEENTACYPLTIDPVAQQAFLKASNAGENDRFGWSVSISGDTAVVGAPDERSNAVGINSDEADNSAAQRGAAYVFVRAGSTWTQQAYLKPSNFTPHSKFGEDVSICGDTIVVGSMTESSGATGVNGDTTGPALSHSGAAYVFVRTGTMWSQQAYLKASNTGGPYVSEGWIQGEHFGGSVAISGDTIVVGAKHEDSDATGINGDELNDLAFNSGAAYIFRRTGTVWAQEAYLKASNTGTWDRFGYDVAISGETVLVSANGEDAAASGVDGDESDNSALFSGAAYIFVRSGTTWSQEAYLKPGDFLAHEGFGHSVAISNNTAIVSEPETVYVFERIGGSWVQSASLAARNSAFIPPHPFAPPQFGSSVAIDSNLLTVGAWYDTSASQGTDGNPTDEAATASGAAYLFVRDGAEWKEWSYLKSSNSEAGDLFGQSVAVSGRSVLVGASGEDSGATSQGADPFDNSATDAGAAYAFEVRGPFYFSSCFGDGGDQAGCTNCPCANDSLPGSRGGCMNSSGVGARLIAAGDASISLGAGMTTDLRFSVKDAPASALCLLVSGAALAPTSLVAPCSGTNSGVTSAFSDGLHCVAQSTRRHGLRTTDVQGEVGTLNSPWGGEGGPPAGIAQAGPGFVAGETRFFQVVYRDDVTMVCTRGLNTSQAVEVLFAP